MAASDVMQQEVPRVRDLVLEGRELPDEVRVVLQDEAAASIAFFRRPYISTSDGTVKTTGVTGTPSFRRRSFSA